MKNYIKNKILKINPHLINDYSLPPNWWWFRALDKRIKNIYIKKYLSNLALGKMYYGGNWDLKAKPFDKTHWYLRINDLKDNLNNFEASLWYQLIVKEINLKGYYLHKKIKISNKAETIYFFENYVMNLINSLKDKKFIQDKTDDVPHILIGRNGELIKSGHGCHRLAIIKVFEVKCEFPIQIIGIHKKFSLESKLKTNNLEDIHSYVTDNYRL